MSTAPKLDKEVYKKKEKQCLMWLVPLTLVFALTIWVCKENPTIGAFGFAAGQVSVFGGLFFAGYIHNVCKRFGL